MLVGALASWSSAKAQAPIDREFWLEQKKFAADEFFRDMAAPDETTLLLRRVFMWVANRITHDSTQQVCYEVDAINEIDAKLVELDRITDIAQKNIDADPVLVAELHMEKVQSMSQALTENLKSARSLQEKVAIAKRIDELLGAQIAARKSRLKNMAQKQIVDMAGKARDALQSMRADVERARNRPECVYGYTGIRG